MSEIIGINIGSHSIKLVGLKMISKGLFLTRVGLKEIPMGTDKEGVNPAAEALKSLISELGLKMKKIRLTVSGSGVHINRISIPSLPKSELKEVIRWEIKDHLPFPVESAQINFHILDEFVEENIKKIDLLVVACPNQLIDRTLTLVREAGLQPTHLDVEPFSLWNALLTWSHFKKEEEIALIDIGAEKTGIHLFKDGILQFSRETTPAGSGITQAIMEGLGSGEEPTRIDEQPERIKKEIGIPMEFHPEMNADKSIDLSKISFLIRPMLEKLSSEIGRSLDYYKTQFNKGRIDKVLLTGGGANLKNIASYLEKELGVPVEHFNPLREYRFDSKKVDVQFLDQMGSIFTIAVGTALPDTERIELLPSKESFFSGAQMRKLAPVLASLITFFIVLGTMWYMNGRATAIQKERDSKMAKVANLDTLQAKLKLLNEKDLWIKQKLSQFPSSTVISVPYRDILKEFHDIPPDNVTLTFLSIQSKGKTFKKGDPSPPLQEGEFQKEEGSELYITGVASGSNVRCLTALAQIIERLERSSLFENVKLISYDENKRYNQAGAKFEIVCNIHLTNPKREEKR